jgi:general secretion pathway protein D
MIRLEIDLEISDIASPDFQGLGPSWAKRTIKDVVVVRDQQSVVIGGLMSDRTTSSESKVPLLGDIPVLGYLFKYKTKTKKKTNLLVLLTPSVVKNQMDIEKIVERRVREQHEFVRSFSSLSAQNYRPEVDYRRKRGLVEEINRAVLRYEEEAAVLRALEERTAPFEDGRIDYFEEPATPDDDESGNLGSDPAQSPPQDAPAPPEEQPPAPEEQP